MQASRRHLICAAALALTAGSVQAQGDYPNRPIKLIVPFPAGGSTDVLLRLIQPKLGQALGQPVVIENKSGASATLGADFVAKAAPDGYTLLVGTLHHTVAQVVFPKLAYRIDTDLVSIGTLAMIPNVVVVNNTVPVKTVAELVALTKAHPDKYNYGSAGPGSAHHLIGEVFKLQTGAKLLHVPYRGSAPAVADLLGGQVSVMFDTTPSAMPHFKSGKTRPLAVTTATRSTALPDVPTLAEAGVPGMDIGTWYGFMAPAGTPAAVISRIHAETAKIMADPAVQKQLQNQGIEPLPGTPAEMQARIKRELAEFAVQVKKANLTID
ncbi:tripartite tricarboxylate transporter substrate binding protein [Pseudorhodoferax sp. Leaf274]|uniref:Bug family tripartite tricarboxylate transporter substrate binding protein n=1 Tax=Pseudorhodoferax sp. Leaf274 TaxID=1736318 RepID=UPI000702D01B|nr:tripartite tricarboxylate transporter substrate binding protein [Pseudorhodoferax sp. Leaf274]KQP49127.1 MFS transporter [Pseudorhodoferax sp. Leaf274]